MRLKIVITSLLALLVLVSCAPKKILKADDFSFIFQEYACGSSNLLDYLDTSKGVLIHTPLDETVSVEIPFGLSEDEMESVYQKMLATDYFEYPSEVIVRGEVPPSTFRLMVINGDFTNDVKWTNDFNFVPNFPQDDGLVELFRLIQRIIRSHPEYPKPNSLCV